MYVNVVSRKGSEVSPGTIIYSLISVKDAVGANVVRSNVGSIDVCSNGNVGLLVGLSDDSLYIGVAVGLSVGLSEGFFDGLSIGVAAGLSVGLSEGLFDGLFVGRGLLL